MSDRGVVLSLMRRIFAIIIGSEALRTMKRREFMVI